MTTSPTTVAPRHVHVLSALDGSNLLAFMAAVGSMRLLEFECPECQPRLRWEHRGMWTPLLETTLPQDEVVQTLESAAHRMAAQPALAIGDNIKLTAEEFRDHRDRFDADADRLENLRWLAAFASDACQDRNSKEGHLEDTGFRTMQGAGHQHFLKSVRTNLASATSDDFASDLFHTWRYDRAGAPLRWDPADDRQHAYRWRDPSSDKSGAVVGALACAGAALSLFVTTPARHGLRTTGFTAARGGPLLTWPIWITPLSTRSAASLMAHPRLQEQTPSRHALESLGVADVFRSRRISVGKMRNFTPAWSP